jgi:hypothetical protein
MILMVALGLLGLRSFFSLTVIDAREKLKLTSGN